MRNHNFQFSILNTQFVCILTVVAAFVMTVTSCSSTQKVAYAKPVNKTAVVSADSAYEDKLQIPFDEKGVDISVKMAFDEPSNILTLTVKGSRKIFVFRGDTYYKKVFRKKFLGRRYLKPEKLSYPVFVVPGTQVTLSNDAYKAFTKPRRKHLFNRWLGKCSGELTLIPPSAGSDDPAMPLICDSIVQRFRIDAKASKATVVLRNLLVMDSASVTGKKKHKVRWVLAGDNDINTTYHINLQRNPCFGLEELRDSTLKRLYDVTNAYHNLINACPGYDRLANQGMVQSRGAKQIFYQHKQLLRSLYLENPDSSACPEVQANIRDYNIIIDSIRGAQCIYIPPVSSSPMTGETKVVATGVPMQDLLDAARRLDDFVVNYALSADAVERRNYSVGGVEIINLMNRYIKEQGIIDADQRKGLAEYRRAEAYFKKMVLR